MHRVFYGRDKYHLHQDMIVWLRANIGPGGWHCGAELSGSDADRWLWFISITFGNSEFEFKNAADAATFKEYWNDRV